MYTEQVAKSCKLCPQMMDVLPIANKCHGSRCMAWRWSEGTPPHLFEIAENPKATTREEAGPTLPAHRMHWEFVPASIDEDDGEPTPARFDEPWDDAEARRTGYCGLAGEPADTALSRYLDALIK